MNKYLDKETIIVFSIALIVLIGWGFWYPRYQRSENAKIQQQQMAAQIEAAKAKAAQKIIVQQAVKPTEKSVAPATVPVKKSAQPAIKYNAVVLANQVSSYEVDPASGSITKITLKDYKTSDRKGFIVFDSSRAPRATESIEFPAGWSLYNVSVDEASKNKNTLKLVRYYVNGKQTLSVTQIFTLPEKSFTMETQIAIANTGKAQLVLPEIKVWTAGVAPMRYFGGDKIYAPMHRIDYCPHITGKLVSLDPSIKEEKFKNSETDQSVDWIGSTNKYFASLLFADPFFDGGIELKRIPYPMPEKNTDFYYVPAIAGIYRNLIIESGMNKIITVKHFAGPKTLAEVKKLPESAISILHISSFSLMEYLARPVLWLLNFLKEWCGSYGIAIILLTLIVRIIFFPLTERGNRSMRQMSKVAPKAKEIREKYKDNPQLMNQKTMELYRQEGVNPLGGCLPILLQIPVFFALYAALDSAVELRQVSFLWATDLTKPDLVGPQFLFGYGIHPLVLLMTALMVIQQKMTPSNMDPAQQKMMMLMPVIMLVILYNLPSGLTLYWTVSQIFSILQMKYSMYAVKRDEEKSNPTPSKI